MEDAMEVALAQGDNLRRHTISPILSHGLFLYSRIFSVRREQFVQTLDVGLVFLL